MAKEKSSGAYSSPKYLEKGTTKKRKLKATATSINKNSVNLPDCLKSVGASGSGRTTTRTSNEKFVKTLKTLTNKDVANSNNNPSISNDSEDAMEWEPTEVEVVHTLQQIRKENTRLSVNTILKSTPNSKWTTSANVHVVLDTNIFLSHLTSLKEWMANKAICTKVQLYVPWMVLQELDYLKSNKASDKLKLETVVRKAASFIFEQINNKNALFRIQTLDEFKNCINLLPGENADDKILQWCLQLKKELNFDIKLLSNDVLFCAKSAACGIQAFQFENFLKNLPEILASVPILPPLCPSTSIEQKLKENKKVLENARREAPSMQKQHDKEDVTTLEASTTFLLQFEDCVLNPFSQMIEYEMKAVYEELWNQIVVVKPPWRLLDIFRCVEKHWIAVFGYVYPRDMRDKIDHLNTIWKRYKNNNEMGQKEREDLVNSTICILQLVQRTRKQFYPNLEKALDELKEMLNLEKVDDSFVLDFFTCLWDRFNFLCGTLADAFGLLNHGLSYKPGSTLPSHQEALAGLRMLLPLLSNIEIAMTRFLKDGIEVITRLESNANELAGCLCLSVNELGISSVKTSTGALSRALPQFSTNAQHRLKMEIGLEQLRVYLQVLHSISSRLH